MGASVDGVNVSSLIGSCATQDASSIAARHPVPIDTSLLCMAPDPLMLSLPVRAAYGQGMHHEAACLGLLMADQPHAGLVAATPQRQATHRQQPHRGGLGHGGSAEDIEFPVGDKTRGPGRTEAVELHGLHTAGKH